MGRSVTPLIGGADASMIWQALPSEPRRSTATAVGASSWHACLASGLPSMSAVEQTVRQPTSCAHRPWLAIGRAYSAAATALRMNSERFPPLASIAATIERGNYTYAAIAPSHYEPSPSSRAIFAVSLMAW